MRKQIFLFVIILAIACNKKDVPSPDFTVTSRSAANAAGDSTWFYFTGNPYNLTFYSGEQGHEYRFRNRTNAPGTPQLQFASTRTNGNAGDTLQVLVSSDFSALYDSADIYNAHWTDITSRAILATTTTSKPSGVVDLSDFVKDSQAVYLAFRYVGTTHAGVQTTWAVTGLAIKNVLSDSTNTFSVATIADGVWTMVNMKNTAVKWTSSATQLQVKGGAANSNVTETWAVSRALVLNRALPDIGVSLKNITNNGLLSYPYIYKAAGEYTASFVGANTTVYDSKSNTKEVKIQVTP